MKKKTAFLLHLIALCRKFQQEWIVLKAAPAEIAPTKQLLKMQEPCLIFIWSPKFTTKNVGFE